jgi:hypothetical protein
VEKVVEKAEQILKDQLGTCGFAGILRGEGVKRATSMAFPRL